MKKSKILALILAAALAVNMSACDGCGGNNDIVNPSPSPDDGVYAEQDFALTDIVLADGGVTDYVIVTPSDNDGEPMKYAAKQLKTHLKNSTGADFSIETDSGITSDKIISLGNTAQFKKAGLTADEQTLTHDGYIIKRVGNSLFIAGANDSGTAFGVWEFLHYEIGYEYYAEGCVYYDTVSTLKLKDFDYTDIPAFEHRSMDGYITYHTEAAYQLRINSSKLAEKAAYICGNNPYAASSTGHGLGVLISPEKYYESHPEWFLAYERNHEFYNICLTADGVVEAVVEEIKQYAEKNPDGYMVDLCQGDGSGIWCSCQACQEEIKTYKHSGYFVRFVNKVIAAMDEWRAQENIERDFEYLMFAYQETNVPPVNSDGTLIDESCKANDKLCIYRTGGAFCYYHDFTDENCSVNAAKAKEYELWNAVSTKCIMWDYGINYGQYLSFHNDFSTIQSHFAYYKNVLNARFLSREMNSGAEHMMFDALRVYLISKLMWNVNYDTEELITNFITNYYGACAPLVSEALNVLRTWWEIEDITSDHTAHQKCALGTSVIQPPKNVLDKAYSLLSEAIELCDDKIANGTTAEADEYSALRKRVLNDRTCLSVQILQNYNDYGYDYNELSNYVSKVESDAAECEIIMYSQHTKLSDFLADYR